MGKFTSQNGETTDVFKTVLFAKRRFGGFEVGVANTGETNGLTYKVEAAAGPKDTIEVPDWSVVDVVATNANVAADAVGYLDITPTGAEHSHYRVAVRSQATGAAATFHVFAEDEKA